MRAEIARLREQLGHAVPAIEQLTAERELYRTRWLASEVDLRLARQALTHEQAPRDMTPREEELVQKALLASSEPVCPCCGKPGHTKLECLFYKV
jgi:hypothetical protein